MKDLPVKIKDLVEFAKRMGELDYDQSKPPIPYHNKDLWALILKEDPSFKFNNEICEAYRKAYYSLSSKRAFSAINEHEQLYGF